MKAITVIALFHFASGKNIAIQSLTENKNGFFDGELNLDIANLPSVIRDIVAGLPVSYVTLLFENFKGSDFSQILAKTLQKASISTSVYTISSEQNQIQFCQYVRESLLKYESITNIVFANRNAATDLFWMVQQQDLMHRKILYIFYWDHEWGGNEFPTDQFEAMRVAVIKSTKSGIYRLYYSQADPSGANKLTMVNWWLPGQGLFRHPSLPSTEKIYQNFEGRVFEVPVLHKPPWNFVEYTNDSFKVDGGRDDKLLTIISEKLNFRYKYIDPPERLQGSGIIQNGTFPGVLEQVWQREVDFFMGDVTITYDRAQTVEFSFFTLVDSEAFVTHRPSKLNEAFALIRPFQWQVWPPIVGTFALYGPMLFLIIEAPYVWKKIKRPSKERRKLFFDCIWFSTSTFLRQGGIYPANSHKVRFVLIIVTLGATYVIGDMYSANLTSLLARPGREKPITTLEQLEMAMNIRGYQLMVEKHGSSYGNLQNGTGIYKRLWIKMQAQENFLIESVESGMKLVRKRKKIAILGGRETLYFDSRRFGSYNFQLSEKLNTRYAAIAMQKGCPYIENFNRILMQLFEGGILTKMTEEEYGRLGEKQRATINREKEKKVAKMKEEFQNREERLEPNVLNKDEKRDSGHQILGVDSRHLLQPLNSRMLQGAFYILFIGYLLSSFILLFEILSIHFEGKLVCQELQNRLDHYLKIPGASRLYNGRSLLKQIYGRMVKYIKNDVMA